MRQLLVRSLRPFSGAQRTSKTISACALAVALREITPCRAEPEPANRRTPVAGTPRVVADVKTRAQRASYSKLVKLARRAFEVALKLLPLWLSYYFRESAIGRPFVHRGVVASRNEWLSKLVATLALLGPMGIKWGQWASTRYDLFEDDVCEALGELTNHAPEHSFAVTKETVERSFGGAPLERIFNDFETEPVASGSIAQVHIATLAPRTQRRRALASKSKPRAAAAAAASTTDATAAGGTARTAEQQQGPSGDVEGGEEEDDEGLGLAAEASRALSTLLTMVSDATGVDVLGSFPFFGPGRSAAGNARGHAEQKVAVKVQHPNLSQSLELDMALLKWVASWAGSRVSQTVDQFANNFECQLDFNDEAENLRRFAKHFKGPFWGSMVSFPQPIDGLVSTEVLVETFEEGESVATFLKRSSSSSSSSSSSNPKEASHGGTAGGDASAVAMSPKDAGERGGSSGGGGGGGMVGLVRTLTSRRSEEEGWDQALKTNIGVTGMQAFLKMLIWDNFIHADLHPGNVLVRMVDIGPLARLQRWVVLGDSGPQAPHIVLLDAGLAASFNDGIYSHVNAFFDSIVNSDGPAMARAILNMDPRGQPYVQNPELFVKECSEIFARQLKVFLETDGGRAGDNIKDFMALVRQHEVRVDPNVMVALMSMMVLEGWQFRLSPEVYVIDNIRNAMGGSVFGTVNRLTKQAQEAIQQLKTHIP